MALTEASDYPAEVARELASKAGGYLRNIIRERGVTCDVCGTPVNAGYTGCRACDSRRMTLGIADLVMPLAYCIEGRQSYEVFRGYKDNPSHAVRERHTGIIELMFFLAFIHHRRCIVRRIGHDIDAYVTIPSLSGRPGMHPFTQMMSGLGMVQDSPRLLAAPGAISDERRLSADQFRLAPEGTDLSGQHVLVLDDTWTTGSHTQSAALTLREHGAEYVSIMTMARYLRPSFGQNAAFIKERLDGRDYDPLICPVTGGACP